MNSDATSSGTRPSWRTVAKLLTLALSTMAVSMPGPSLADTFTYVGNAETNDVSIFKLDPGSGDMSLVATPKLAGVDKAGGSTPLAVSPDKRFLYVGVRSEPLQVITFSIDPATGGLKQLGSAPLADSMASIATDRTGRFLLSASYGGNKVSVNPIGEDGLVQPPSQVVPTGPNAHLMIAAPDNRHALATNLGSDDVLSFALEPKTGTLTPAASPSIKVAAGAGPRHFTFSPDGKSIYLLGELDAVVRVMSYDAATGGLNELGHASAMPTGFDGKPWGADIHVTPDGRFVYASERTSSTIAGFAVGADGQLTPLGNVATETQPRGFNIDPSGRYLAAVGQLSHGMTVYSIDQGTGKLTKLKSYPTGKNPNWVEFIAFP